MHIYVEKFDSLVCVLTLIFFCTPANKHCFIFVFLSIGFYKEWRQELWLRIPSSSHFVYNGLLVKIFCDGHKFFLIA